MARFNRPGYCGAERVRLGVLQSHSINAGSDGMNVVMKRLAIPDAGQPEVRSMNVTQRLGCKVDEQVLIRSPFRRDNAAGLTPSSAVLQIVCFGINAWKYPTFDQLIRRF